MKSLSRWFWVGWALILFVGCSKADVGEVQHEGTPDLLLDEAEALQSSLALSGALRVLFVVVGAWLLGAAVSRTIFLLWRMGFDTRRRLAPIRTGAHATIALTATWIVVSRLARAAPVVALVVGSLGLVALMVVLSAQVQSFVVGLGLALRRSLREGDRVEVGGESGIVRQVGLMSIQVRRPDGATAIIPNRVLAEQPLRMTPARNTVPVVVELPLAAPPDDLALRAAHRAAVLSPYRAVHSSVSVKVHGERGTQVLRVELQALSERVAEQASRHLRHALRDVTTEEPARE